MTFSFLLNGTDFTNDIQHKDFSETLRKIEGAGAGTAINGNRILDVIAVKHDLKVSLKPLTPDKLSALMVMISQPSISVTYFSGLVNDTVTREMAVNSVDAQLLMLKQQTKGFFGNSQLNLEEI